MVFLGITRLKFYLLINIRHPLSAHGEISPIESYLLALKMLVLLSSGPCRTLSTISSILQSLTSTYFRRDDIFSGRHISRTTYYRDNIFLGPHDIRWFFGTWFFADGFLFSVKELGFWMLLAPICILYCKQCNTMYEYNNVNCAEDIVTNTGLN